MFVNAGRSAESTEFIKRLTLDEHLIFARSVIKEYFMIGVRHPGDYVQTEEDDISFTKRLVDGLRQLPAGPRTESILSETTKERLASLARAFVVSTNERAVPIAGRMQTNAGGIETGGRTRPSGYRDACLLFGGVICQHLLGGVHPHARAHALTIFRDSFVQHLRNQLDVPAAGTHPDQFVVQGIVAGVHMDALDMFAAPDIPRHLGVTFGEPCNLVEAAFVCYMMAGPSQKGSPKWFHQQALEIPEPEPEPDAAAEPETFCIYVVKCFIRVMEALVNSGGQCVAYQKPFMHLYYKDVVPGMCRYINSAPVKDITRRIVQADRRLCQLLTETMFLTPTIREGIEHCGLSLGLWAEMLDDLHMVVPGTGELLRGEVVAMSAIQECVWTYPPCAEFMANISAHLQQVHEGRRMWSVFRAAWLGAIPRARAHVVLARAEREPSPPRSEKRSRRRRRE
jgi:hypothetical protein